MNYDLVAIDIDDTLLTSEKVISKKNQKMIQEALNNGVKVVLCSGRPHKAMEKYAATLGIKGSSQYMITNGGAIIEDMNGKILAQQTLSNDFYREFVGFANENNLGYSVFDVHGNVYTDRFEQINRYTVAMAFENDNGLFLRRPDDLPNDFEITKAAINAEEDVLDKIEASVSERFKDYFVVRTGVGYLEIFPKTVNKGHAVTKLAKLLDIDLSKVMTFGDRDNDIPMLKIAGKGVAMANATTGAKAVSDYITTDNNHDGVGNALEKFL